MGAGADPSWRAHRVPGNVGSPQWPDRHRDQRAELVARGAWRDYPASVEPRRNLRPRVATRGKWARIEALMRNRAFVVEYASARERWRNGVAAVFPAGTY